MGDSPAGSPTLPTTLSLFSDFTSLYLMPSSNGFSIRVIIVMNEFYLPVTNMIQKVFNPIWIALFTIFCCIQKGMLLFILP